MPSPLDYLNLSTAVYTTGGAPPTAPSGWTVIAFQTTANGMQAAAFQNQANGLAHEIGQALGFSDNADPTSVMGYDLTASNRSISSSDATAAAAVYHQA